MKLPQKKKVVIHWKPKTPWRLGAFWFIYGSNLFTREEYRSFEVHPLFLRQVAEGKVVVEDPEYPAAPKDEPAQAVEQPLAEEVVMEGDDVEEAEPAKKKSRRKDSEGSPS